MLKNFNVKYDVLTLQWVDLNIIKYLIQHGWNKNINIQLIKNLVEGNIVTLEHMDNKEQLTVMFKTKQIKNISRRIGTCIIKDL